MKGATGILLIVVGLIMLYVVLSDKYGCFVQFYDCLLGVDYKTSEGFTKSDTPASPGNKLPAGPAGFDIFKMLRCAFTGGPGCPPRGAG